MRHISAPNMPVLLKAEKSYQERQECLKCEMSYRIKDCEKCLNITFIIVEREAVSSEHLVVHSCQMLLKVYNASATKIA